MSCLVNIGHQKRNPECARAALRICAVFNGEDEVQDYISDMKTDVDAFLVPLGRWFVLMRQRDQNEAEHLQRLETRYRARLREHEEEFEANRAKQCAGSFSAEARPAAETQCETAGRAPQSLCRAKEMRMQNYAVISVLGDYTQATKDDREPGVTIWSVHDSEEEAKAHIKTQLSTRVTDFHLDVVAMYEWLYPTNVDLNQIQEEFRDKDLTEIMKHRKEQKYRVEKFKRECEEGKKEVPILEIGGTPPEICTLTTEDGVVLRD